MSPKLWLSIAALLLAVSVTNALPLGFGPNIVDVAVATPELSTLVTALKLGQLVKVLSGLGPFTVFAPSNVAFDKLPASALAKLLDPSNINELDNLLEYHVVAGAAIQLKNLANFPLIKTLADGSELKVHASNGGSGEVFFVNSAIVFRGDVAASNGVIHLIDSVLMPPAPPAPPAPLKSLASTIQDTPELSTFVTACKEDGVYIGFNPYDPHAPRSLTTVFAPTNKAFASFLSLYPKLLDPSNALLLEQVLKYHIVTKASLFSKDITDNEEIKTELGQIVTAHVAPYVQSGLKINNADVITKDTAATDGVLHIVDSVLMLPNFPPPGNYTFPFLF